MWQELIKKIELQSIIVLLVTLLFGFLLLKLDNSFQTPAGVLGSVLIAFGVLYTFGSFFSNQIKESYKDVILEYKSTISTMRTAHRDAAKSYKETAPALHNSKAIGDYQILQSNNETTREG